MIGVRGLTRTFTGRTGPVEAVRGIDLDVAEGEVLGFLGPNGAGKTTTVRMLATLLDPTGGTARIAGFDVVRERAEVRRRIGFVGQGGSAGPDHPVYDELCTQARLHGMSRAEARERADRLCTDFRLTGLENRLAKTLSGGQRRRADLALGLVSRPVVLFLDEPTAGLDPTSRAALWEYVRALRAEHGTTVFLTTHYLDEADQLCDRIAVVDGGRIIADDTPEALKDELASDTVVLGTDQVSDAARVLARVVPDGRLDTVPGAVHVRVVGAQHHLAGILRALDAEGVPLTSVQVKRPSLDDVFLALTGRDTADPAAADAAADAGTEATADTGAPADAAAPDTGAETALATVEER